MQVEQFVMAYLVEQDRLRAMLPEGYQSLRPVLRVNAEIRDDKIGYLEFNTAVEKDGVRGWLNIANWDDISYQRDSQSVIFKNKYIQIMFRQVGITGGCPAEKDNEGCFFLGNKEHFRPTESVLEKKEFCDCTFDWIFDENGANGVSIGETLPAIPSELKIEYPKVKMSLEYVATIPCEQVLGTYKVVFCRTKKRRLGGIVMSKTLVTYFSASGTTAKVA